MPIYKYTEDHFELVIPFLFIFNITNCWICENKYKSFSHFKKKKLVLMNLICCNKFVISNNKIFKIFPFGLDFEISIFYSPKLVHQNYLLYFTFFLFSTLFLKSCYFVATLILKFQISIPRKFFVCVCLQWKIFLVNQIFWHFREFCKKKHCSKVSFKQHVKHDMAQ